MAISVVIKVFDSVNNLDFEIPISSETNSPLSINKELSDLIELTKRGGVQSRKFKIPISKEVARNYDFFNEAQHHNGKDVDGDKDAAIIIDGNELERGTVRVINYVNKDGFESLELLFLGNNFAWTELVKDLTLADLTWNNNSLVFNPNTIKNSWANHSNDGDEWVFPLENRGGRKLASMVHTEDFRPSLFIYKVIERCLFSVGYTFQSDFLETSLPYTSFGFSFKSLILTFFGKRFRNSEQLISDNFVRIGYVRLNEDPRGAVRYVGAAGSGSFLIEITKPINLGEYPDYAGPISIDFNDFSLPNTDVSDNFDPSIGNSQVNNGTTYFSGRFTAPLIGIYDFSLVMVQRIYSSHNVNVGSVGTGKIYHTMFVKRYNSLGAFISDTVIIGTCTGSFDPTPQVDVKWDGKVSIPLDAGDYIEVFNTYSSFDPDQGFHSTLLGFGVDIYDLSFEITLSEKIVEGTPFNLSDVVDDKVKVLDIINDLSRMFNLMFDADPVLKKVTIEPRNDFYRSIEDAKDFTSKIDVSKTIQTNYNSSFHKRDFIFSYKNDTSDVFVQERNRRLGTTLSEYSHSLSAKFQNGTTQIKTNVLASTINLKDYDSIDITQRLNAPYTARYWNEYTEESPVEMLEDHAPRILNYRYFKQQYGGGGFNAFRFYDEISDRTTIPFCLPHGNGQAIVGTNLYWHTVASGLTQKGLFNNYWGKTITEISSGVNSNVFMLLNQKNWNDFSFKNVIYINEPIDIKGYWVVEKISNYQPENSSIVKVKLLQRIEYEAETEQATEYNEILEFGNLAVKKLSGEFNMTMTVEDGNGNEINVLMETTDLNGTKTTLLT